MSAIETLIEKAEKIGRDFESHKIFFHKRIINAILVSNIFNNRKLSELITNLENTVGVKNKLELCSEILRSVALKRVIITNDYNNDLKIALQTALLYYFNFVDSSPLRGILELYQEEISKGNYVVLKLNLKEIKEPIISFLAAVLAEKLREIISASEYTIRDKTFIISLINKKFKKINIYHKRLLFEFLKFLFDKFTIKIIDENESENIYLDIFLDSLIYYFDEALKILKLIDPDEWLKNIISKYRLLLKKIYIQEYNDTINVYDRDSEKSDIRIVSSIEMHTPHSVIDLESFRKVISRYGNRISNGNRHIVGLKLKETQLEDYYYQVILPYRNKKNNNEFDSFSFVCENCLEISCFEYCENCRREKRLTYYCNKCGIANEYKRCISCDSTLSPILKFKEDPLKLIEEKLIESNITPEKIQKLKFSRTFFYPSPCKLSIRLKHNQDIAENGVAEIVLPIIVSDYIEDREGLYQIKDDEILLPESVLEKLKKINSYILELINIYRKEDLKDFCKESIEEGDIILARSIRGLIFYPLTIKGFIKKSYGIISKTLYDALYGEIIADNLIRICLPQDFLLNASALYLDDLRGLYILTDIPKREKKSEALRISLEESSNETQKDLSFAIYFKQRVLQPLTNAIKENITMKIKCPRCENLLDRPKMNIYCPKCKNRITYKWFKKEINALLKEYSNFTQLSSLSILYRKNNRRLKRYVYTYFKEEERFEKLDKFFNI
jgi:hypothetical protein